MADWKVPGATVAVVQDDKLVLAKAYGQRDVEANLPAEITTQFLICSISKSFTATAVALLHNEGRLDWAKPVRDYLPEFRLHDPVATERVTIRDLLSHNTGLPRHDWVHLPADRAPAEMFGVLQYLEPSRDIRSAYQYSNLCYNVAGLLIERVSGQSYDAFIRTRLTDRLGMKVSFSLDDLRSLGRCGPPLYDSRGHAVAGHPAPDSDHRCRSDQHHGRRPRKLDAVSSGQRRIQRRTPASGDADRRAARAARL